MIDILKPSHKLEEYLECVEDLMGGVEKVSLETVGSRMVFMKDHYQVYVMIEDDRIVATAALMLEYKLRYEKPKAYIEDVAVHKGYRGRGYGKKMVEHCIDVAKGRECYKIVLSCKDHLVDFYGGLGFEKDQNFMVRK